MVPHISPSDISGNGDSPAASPQLPATSEPSTSAAEDAAMLRRIVLFLVLCGLAGFALLIASIAVDWNGG